MVSSTPAPNRQAGLSMLLICGDCGAVAGELPFLPEEKRWIRCPECGGRLVNQDELEEDAALARFLCPRCLGPLTESVLGVWECRNGCRITPKFVLGHHTMQARKHYMSVSG